MIFLVTLLISTLFNENRYAKVFGYSFFEVESYSMYPELTKGDLVVVKKRESFEYEVGMVVTYICPTDSIPTTHKIVQIDGNIITTRGINEVTNTSDDTPFDVKCIIGEVVTVWYGYSKTKDFITNPFGVLIILLTGFLLLEGFNLLEDSFMKKEK